MRLISKKKFLSEPANFSASNRLGRNFPTVQNGLEKGKKRLNLIKLVLKWKRAIRKGHTSFLLFHLWDLKFVPIDSNSFFFQKCRCDTKKSSQTWKSSYIFSEMSFVIYSCKTANCWNQNVFTNLQNFIKFWKNSKNSSNIAKRNRVFPGKEIEPWFWQIWIAQWLKFFPNTAYLFQFRPSSVGPKVQILGPSLFHENSNLSIFFFKHCFCLLEYLFWWEFRQYWTIFGAVRAQKPHKKDHFMDAESVRKTS